MIVMRDPTESIGRGPQPETPRSEPEILPPDHARGQARARTWTASGARGRVFVARPGPFTLILALLVIGFVAALALILLLGLVVLWVPILVAGIIAALFSGAIRRA